MKRSGALALFPLLAFAGLALALGKGVNQPAEPAFVGQLDRPLPEFDLSPPAWNGKRLFKPGP